MPKVKVKYFARYRDLLGVAEEEYYIDDNTTLMDLLFKYIPEKHQNVSKSWREMIFEAESNEIEFNNEGKSALKYYYSMILTNGSLEASNYRLKDGDNIAIHQPGGGG